MVAIAPEGTRKYNPTWKTGFFYIAQNAGIPIVLVAIDFPSKSVIIRDPLIVEGEVQPFISELQHWFSGFQGKNPELGVISPKSDSDNEDS